MKNHYTNNFYKNYHILTIHMKKHYTNNIYKKPLYTNNSYEKPLYKHYRNKYFL